MAIWPAGISAFGSASALAGACRRAGDVRILGNLGHFVSPCSFPRCRVTSILTGVLGEGFPRPPKFLEVAVYVDKLFETAPIRGQAWWCHMTADTLEELHEMAERIGMKREWFQDKRRPHYDLPPSTRALAVQQGAIEIDQYAEARARIRARRTIPATPDP
ncbi:DUF4031 domain-containing protein [bacterium]|nr:MAG: DUF4031 domain-containing protein [bacterium]